MLKFLKSVAVVTFFVPAAAVVVVSVSAYVAVKATNREIMLANMSEC